MKPHVRFFILLATSLACALNFPVRAADEKLSQDQIAFFEKNIRPVLASKCYGCHSAKEKTKGGLQLDTRDAMRRGGESGPGIVPGKPDESEVIKAIRYTDKDTQMPPQKVGGKNGRRRDRGI